MSGSKLEKSLEEILNEKRVTARARRDIRRNRNRVKGSVNGNGVIPTLDSKRSSLMLSLPSTLGSHESKIIVSNLPTDVTESQIKDYFSQTVGPVRRVTLTYGPDGQSRGVCTIIFNNPNGAAKAAKDLDGLKVDKRPMKIELVVGAKVVSTIPGAPARLSDRISGRRPRKHNRPPKPKTAEELDAEMADYWESKANGESENNTTIGSAPAATSATETDTRMDEDILVS